MDQALKGSRVPERVWWSPMLRSRLPLGLSAESHLINWRYVDGTVYCRTVVDDGSAGTMRNHWSKMDSLEAEPQRMDTADSMSMIFKSDSQRSG